MAVKGPNHQMRTRIRGLTVLFALIGFGLVGVRLLYMQVFNHDFYVQQATALQTRVQPLESPRQCNPRMLVSKF